LFEIHAFLVILLKNKLKGYRCDNPNRKPPAKKTQPWKTERKILELGERTNTKNMENLLKK